MFKFLCRFVSLSGIGAISQSVADEIVAQLLKPDLSDAEFQSLQNLAQKQGYLLERV
jgi:hypothetical protein